MHYPGNLTCNRSRTGNTFLKQATPFHTTDISTGTVSVKGDGKYTSDIRGASPTRKGLSYLPKIIHQPWNQSRRTRVFKINSLQPYFNIMNYCNLMILKKSSTKWKPQFSLQCLHCQEEKNTTYSMFILPVFISC